MKLPKAEAPEEDESESTHSEDEDSDHHATEAEKTMLFSPRCYNCEVRLVANERARFMTTKHLTPVQAHILCTRTGFLWKANLD